MFIQKANAHPGLYILAAASIISFAIIIVLFLIQRMIALHCHSITVTGNINFDVIRQSPLEAQRAAKGSPMSLMLVVCNSAPTDTQTAYVGAFNNGETVRSHTVTVHLDAAALSIFDAQDNTDDAWPFNELHAVSEAFEGTPVRLNFGATGQARLTVKDPTFRVALLNAAPDLRRNPNLGFKRIVGMIGSVVVLAAALIIATPYVTGAAVDWIPNSWKLDAGERMVTEVLDLLSENGALCEQGDGAAALNQMTARLLGAPRDVDLETKVTAPLALNVQVANIAHNNAFAMLGGQIVLFNGLLFRAKPPEEVAVVKWNLPAGTESLN